MQYITIPWNVLKLHVVVGSCFSMVTHTLWTKHLEKPHIGGVRNVECYARIRTINVEHGNASNHSHPLDEAQNCVLKVLDRVKNKTKHSEEVSSSVINNTTRNTTSCFWSPP